jgi:hypothetical protein
MLSFNKDLKLLNNQMNYLENLGTILTGSQLMKDCRNRPIPPSATMFGRSSSSNSGGVAPLRSESRLKTLLSGSKECEGGETGTKTRDGEMDPLQVA